MWKYVMVGFDSDYMKYCFSDMMNYDTFLFLNNTMGDGMLSKIQKLCVSEVTNKHFNVPLKQIWMSDYSRWLKYCEYDICFVFSKSQSWLLEYNGGEYIRRLRKQYPSCKIVLYLGDLISSYVRFDVNFFLSNCDHVISYDADDSSRYHLIYAPLPYSKVSIPEDSAIPAFDVFFCGKAKNRLEEIHSIYDFLTNKGLKALFFITGVKKNEQKRDGIVYNRRLKYSEYLQYMNKSKAIVEIKQKDSVGDTLRVKEAFTYGKMLITDNSEINKRAFLNSEQVFIYNEKTGIDIEKFLLNKGKVYEEIKFDELFQVLNKICDKDK